MPACIRQANIKPKSLPVMWRSNGNTWTTTTLFTEWLYLINKIMKASNRNILLFIDNAPSHPDLKLSNIQLKYFPPNMTADIQFLDQGIIHAVQLIN